MSGCWNKFTHGCLLLCLMCGAAHSAVLSGMLETRLEHRSDDGCSLFLTQWLDLNYRASDALSGVASGTLQSGPCGTSDLYRLYIDTRLDAPAPLGLKLGRFEQSNGQGFYTLDGLEVTGKWAKARWSLFAGIPRRSEFYPELSDRPESKLDSVGDRLLGGSLQIPLELSEQPATLGLGIERIWGEGQSGVRLDGRFQLVREQPMPNIERLELDAALSLRPDEGELVDYDLRLRLYPDARRQISLGAYHYDPPEEPISFQGRFYQTYARGPQHIWQAGYLSRDPSGWEWGGKLRAISRDRGSDAVSGDLQVGKKLPWGWHAEGRIGHLEAGYEQRQQLFVGLNRNLNSRWLLKLSGARFDERTWLAGGKNVTAAELRLQWMWKRGLYVTALAEAARVDYRDGLEDYNENRFGLRLRYELPALGQEDYR